MSPQKLKELRKRKKMTQAQLAEWLGVKTRTVVAWENNQNPIPEAIARTLEKPDAIVLNPTLTLEQFNKIQEAAKSEGISVDEWIANIIKKSIILIGILSLIAKLIHNPTDWSGEALAQAGVTGLSWFGKGIYAVCSFGWQVLS